MFHSANHNLFEKQYEILGGYEPDESECGFLYPSFKDRSADIHTIDIFYQDLKKPHKELWENLILGN